MENKERHRLVEAALAARANAYVPYSRYRVGAALLTAKGEIITGANVENASYGLTLCAERTAIIKAVSEGHRDFRALAVAVDSEVHAAPCGACRQVMEEFFTGDTVIYLVNARGDNIETNIAALLPNAFSKANL